MSPEPKRAGATGDLYRYSGLGLQFAATVVVFAFAGRWLDGRTGTSPLALLFGVFLGFGLGLYSMVKKLPSSPKKPGAGKHPMPPSDTP
ncbi:MAG: AtpZ/AtpI family protein [Planctomycetes bacterium]|nr:AtpZ/AtpI family protein [Planctomycetota bacterium]